MMNDRSLRSLNVFLDVVFALMFFKIIEYLPSFEDNLTRVGFGVIIVVYYWSRKNAPMSVVDRANGVIAVLAIASIFFLCLFVWTLVADPTYVGGSPTRLLQSVSILLGSLLALLALHYAIRAGLTKPELTSAAEQIARVDLSNPLTAAIAFVLMPLLSFLLARLPGKAA